jgi:hypothetical protein
VSDGEDPIQFSDVDLVGSLILLGHREDYCLRLGGCETNRFVFDWESVDLQSSDGFSLCPSSIPDVG